MSETPVEGHDYFSDYLEWSQTWFKTNLKSIMSSGFVYVLSRVNPYRPAGRPQKHLFGYAVDDATFEATHAFVMTYSSAIEDIIVNPVFMNVGVDFNKTLLAGARAYYSRMFSEYLFSETPDYIVPAIHGISAVLGDYVGEYVGKMLEGKTTEPPPVPIT